MSFPQAIIFDVDGTLADNERDGHRVAFNRAFAEAGLDWVWSESAYGELLQIGGGKERMRHYIQTVQPALPPVDDLDEMIRELHAAKRKFYGQLIQSGAIPLRPGVLRLLEDCRQAGVRLAIATTSALPSAEALVSTIADDALSWFEVIAAGDMVAAKKPAPDIYSHALEKLQLSPSECVAIEDSKPGLQAATAAGLKTIVTVNGYTQHEDFAEAALVLSHLGEPDKPFRVLGGTLASQATEHCCVDVPLLQTLCN